MPSMIAQQLSNLDVQIRHLRVGNFIRSRFNEFKRLLTRVWDPLVYQMVGNFRLAMPLSHPIATNLATFPLYDRQIPTVISCLHKKYENLCMIDIGANIGDTAALARSAADIPVLCVEGSPLILSYLKINQFSLGNVSLAETFVGSEDGHFDFNVVYYTAGSASIDRTSSGDRKIPISTIETIISAHPRFKKTKFLKVDTDGFDAQILRATANFLQEAQPVILFEFDRKLLQEQGDAGTDVFALLQRLGYSSFMVYDNFGNFLVSLDARDTEGIADLVSFYTNMLSPGYCDVMAFHKVDEDLHAEFRNHERLRCENGRAEFAKIRRMR